MSRKLDALVAERVMGWQWFISSNPTKDIYYLRPVDKFVYGAIKEGDDVEYLGGLPAYSIDIAAAVDILRKMRADGWHYSIDTWPAIICNNPDLVGVTFGKLASDLAQWENEYAFVGATIELAICIAALLARGVTQAEIDEALGVTA